MEISVIESKNLINVEFNNDKVIFFKNCINVLFISFDNTYEIEVLNNIEKLQSFESKKNRCIKYFIFIYEFNDDEKLLRYFIDHFNFNFLNYINLNLYWFSLIFRYKNQDYIYEERLLRNIEKKINISLEIDLDCYNTNQYKNIEDEIHSFENQINNFSDNLKKLSLDELNTRKKKIYLQYNNLEKYINSIREKYEIISDKIKTKMEDIRKLNLNISNIHKKKNSSIDLMLEEKNNYLINLINFIEITEQKKNKSLSNLNNVNSLIENKKSNIKLLEDEIVELKNFKVSHYKEISKLKSKKQSISIPNRNLAVMVHVYNLAIYEDIYSYIKKLHNLDFDLYINLASNNNKTFEKPEYKKFISKLNEIDVCDNLYITYSDNKGMDIGGFLTSYIKMIDLGLNYNSIIKIHTKSNDNWRFAMLYALLGTESIINNNLKLIKSESVGMIGNDLIPLQSIVNRNSFRYINTYLKLFNITYNNQGHFVPGTIFWIKGSILRNYFNKQKLITSYNSFQQDYCGSKENRKEGRPHAFERFFGMLVESSGNKSVRFDSNPEDYN